MPVPIISKFGPVLIKIKLSVEQHVSHYKSKVFFFLFSKRRNSEVISLI